MQTTGNDKGPCSRGHPVDQIPRCSACLSITVHESKLTLPRELVQAACKAGFVQSYLNKYYLQKHIIKLKQCSDHDQRKILALASGRIVTPKLSTLNLAILTPKLATPKLATPKLSIPTPKVSIPTPKLTTPKLAIQTPRASIQTPKLATSKPTTIPTPKQTTIPTPKLGKPETPSLFSPVRKPSSPLIQITFNHPYICVHCGIHTKLFRRATDNYLCTPCRKLPQHVIVEERFVFRNYPNICYNMILKGIEMGRVRKLRSSAYRNMHGSMVVQQYYYKSDIERIIT